VVSVYLAGLKRPKRGNLPWRFEYMNSSQWAVPRVKITNKNGFECTQLARQVRTAGTSKGGGAVIRKPGSAWLEGTPVMDHGMNEGWEANQRL